MRRKIRELLLTIWLERTFTKNEILEIYLNRVYLGSGTWGVDAASRMYFGISARKVNLWQAAVLAGLPQAPSRFNPRANPAAATARAKEVLAAMVDTGAISAERARAEAAKITFPKVTRQDGAWFADWASDQVQSVLPPDRDATVRTTMDQRLQIAAETALSTMLDGPGAAADVGQGAVVMLDAASGAVRVMVGGRDYRDSNFNRAVNARRQPGSAFKPFVWLTALENGMTPADTGAGRTDSDRQLATRGLRARIPWRDHAGRSFGALGQYRVGAAVAALRRRKAGGGDGGPAGDRKQDARQRVAWHWAPGRWGCWN